MAAVRDVCQWSIHHSSLYIHWKNFWQVWKRNPRNNNNALAAIERERETRDDCWLIGAISININQQTTRRRLEARICATTPHHSIYLFLTAERWWWRTTYLVFHASVDCYYELLLTFEMNKHICVRAPFIIICWEELVIIILWAE